MESTSSNNSFVALRCMAASTNIVCWEDPDHKIMITISQVLMAFIGIYILTLMILMKLGWNHQQKYRLL